MSQHVVSIEKLDRKLVLQAGTKSVQLGLLAAAGFRVPGAFCVLASGYDLFVGVNALQDRILRSVRKASSGKKTNSRNTESRIVEIFREADFPESLEVEILSAYRRLSRTHPGSAPVAVRSSGSWEDGANASFAGQFDSFLNVRGEEELLAKIKRCWAGFWKAASLCYQMDRCETSSTAGIAVLVQKMVHARSAGVVFSANPISGSDRQIVIEASWGLGEAIVDGIVTPDRFVVDAPTNRIVEQAVQNKKYMVVLSDGKRKNTRRIRVPAAKQSVPCLTEDQIERLAAVARRVQEHFGGPQDIEWAYDGRQIYLLQARPITTLHRPDQQKHEVDVGQGPDVGSEFDTDADPDTEWTSSTIMDMLPGALSPLTMSQMKALEYGFRKPQMDLGLLPPRFEPGKEIRFLGFFYNRAHLNMSLIRSLVHRVPLVSSGNLERMLQDGVSGDPGNPRLSLRFVLDAPNMVRLGLHALKIVRRLQPAADALLTTGLSEYEEESRRKAAGPSDPRALLLRLDAVQARRAEIYAAHITASQFGEVTFQLLKRLVGRLSPGESGILASQLISGSSTPLFAKPMAELWSLGQQVSGSRKLGRFFSADSIETVWRNLKSDGSRPVRIFLDAFQVFLAQYGYRSRYGAELMRPSWDEEPMFILSIVRIYSRLLLTLNPWEMERRQTQRRLDILRGLESRLRPVSGRLLNELLNLMHTLIPLRQNMRALSLMQARLSRRIVQQIEGMLVSAGVLFREGDAFFLTMEELYELIEETTKAGAGSPAISTETRKRVARRKEEYQRNLNIVLPGSFRGRPKPVLEKSAPAAANAGRRLHGIPASPGRVTGQARRITAPVQDVRVRPGEILVLPGMDPGWTPLFLSAAAIITERGGILSHGSILAREYGIPAITGVADATQRIETGQVITVDGDRGEIWL